MKTTSIDPTLYAPALGAELDESVPQRANVSALPTIPRPYAVVDPDENQGGNTIGRERHGK